MPNYDFLCESCGHAEERMQPMSAPLPACSKCGDEMQKVYHECQRAVWRCDPCTPGHGYSSKQEKRWLNGFVDKGVHHKMRPTAG